MDKRILEIISNALINKKVQSELELEKLVNGQYNLSVEELTNRSIKVITELSNTIHSIKMWEDILSQSTQINEKPTE